MSQHGHYSASDPLCLIPRIGCQGSDAFVRNLSTGSNRLRRRRLRGGLAAVLAADNACPPKSEARTACKTGLGARSAFEADGPRDTCYRITGGKAPGSAIDSSHPAFVLN